MPIEPGSRLGAYEVKELLGRGAMGVVYRAYHPGLNRQVAVKVLQALAPDPDAAARFRREAQSIAQMRHPNVLQVFDFGEFEGVPYSIVEYVPGGSLADRLRAGQRPSPQTTVALLRGVAAALDYGHGLGVIHRDVKPANVLLGRDDVPVLADFGLVKLLQSASVRSLTGTTSGTPAYMSPEQVSGAEIGPASDRYSLSCMTFELLTGSVPFEGLGVLEQLYAHVHREPPAVSSLNSQLGPAVDAVLARGLAKAPEERWPSCGELVEALAAALPAGAPALDSPPLDSPPLVDPLVGGVPAERGRGPAPAVGPAGARGPAAAPPTPPTQRKGRLSVILAAGGGLALLLLLVIIANAVAGSAATSRGGPTTPRRGATVAVSQGEVPAGADLVVSATNLPANQTGTIQLLSSPVRLGSFNADKDGSAAAEVTIPKNTPPGAHRLAFCWNGSCPASSALTVLQPLPTTPPTPTPGPSATPRPGFHPQITTVLPSPVRINGQVFVSGGGFDPAARGFTVILIEYGHDGTTLGIQDKPVEANGSFTWEGKVPTGNFVPGQAFIRVCNIGEGDVCADKAVTLTR